MSILNMVTNVNPPMGIRAVISAQEKVGKTTILSSMPRPLLVPLEQGYAGITMNKTPMLEHYAHVMSLMDELIAARMAGQLPYMTIAFDSATALERLIHQAVLESDPTFGKGNKKALTMEAALGGYGKAYQYANELFANFLAKCDQLALKGGVNIVLTCHVFAAEVVDPTAGTYNIWDLLLHSPKNQKTYGKREMLTQWADMVGFLHEPIFVTEGEKGKMSRAASAGQGRVLGLTRTTGYVAGNRFGVTKEISIPPVQGWNEVAQAIYESKGLDFYNRDV